MGGRQQQSSVGASAGLEGLQVRNLLTYLRIIRRYGDVENFTTSRFADDLRVVVLVTTSSVHKALDMVDVYGCGSGGSADTKKTLGMTLTPTTAPAAGPGGSYDDDAPTYVRQRNRSTVAKRGKSQLH